MKRSVFYCATNEWVYYTAYSYCRFGKKKSFVQITWQLLPPANEVCKGYVSTGVCLSTGGGVSAPLHAGIHPLADTPLDRHPPAQCMLGYTPPCPVHAGIWSTNRCYASHWNAFLLSSKFYIDIAT